MSFKFKVGEIVELNPKTEQAKIRQYGSKFKVLELMNQYSEIRYRVESIDRKENSIFRIYSWYEHRFIPTTKRKSNFDLFCEKTS